MQKVRVAQNSFQFGEISDSLIMRTDSPVYAASAQHVENMVVTAEGSVKKRFGLKNHHDYSINYNSSYPEQSHLFKFEFDDNEAYIISIGHEEVRCFFLDNSGVYTSAGNLHLVETITQDTSSNDLPFDQEYLQEYTVAQYGDAMFICHPLFAPRVLTRTALDAFEISVYSFDTRADNKITYQPYSTFQDNGVTLDPSAISGNGITLTTSASYWVPDHVGVTVRYHESEILITGYTSSTVVTGNIVDTLKIRLSVLNPLRTADGSNLIEVTHLNHGLNVGDAITIEGASATGGINTAQLNVTDQVREIIDENTYTYQAGGTANDSEDGGGNVKVVSHAPIRDWDEQSWSAVRGYPAAVTFHENRLCFGGTIAEPDNIWMSKIGSFFNFDVGEAADDDSIQLVAATGDVNQIRYLVSNRDLQVFTATGELYIPTYLNQAITPTNAQIRKQTPYGCEFLQPLSIDGATIFAEKGKKGIREYLYTESEEAYTSTSISAIASHLIDNPKYLSVVHSGFGLPDSYAAITLGSGDIALFSSNRAEKRASWSRVTTDGNFSSVASIHNRLFADVWYDNKLQLCEFTDESGLDNYLSATYLNTSFDVTRIRARITSGSTSAKIDFYGGTEAQRPDNKSFIILTGLTNSAFGGQFSAKGIYLSNLNDSPKELFTRGSSTIGSTTTYFVTYNYTLGYTPSSDSTVDWTSASGVTLFPKRILNVGATYSAGDTVDLIKTDNGSKSYSTATILSGDTNYIDLLTHTPDDNTKVYVGKKFDIKLVTNPVDASVANGPATGSLRGITNVVVDLKGASSLKINSRSVSVSEFTGKKEIRLLGYSRNPQITIEQDSPLELQVNGLVAELII